MNSMTLQRMNNRAAVHSVTMPKRDYFLLPDHVRQMDGRPYVLATVNHRQVFVPVRLLG